MSETLKMIVRELPRTMGELNHQLLYDDLKQALKEVKELEHQLTIAHRSGWEQAKREAQQALCEICCYNSADNPVPDECTTCNERRAIASMEYKGGRK